MKKLLFVLATCLFVLISPDLQAQEQEWELDRIKRRKEQKERELDSILVHLKNRWKIKLTYGRMHFANGAKSGTVEAFTLPDLQNRLSIERQSSIWKTFCRF